MSKSKVLTWAVVACAMVAFATAADAKSVKQLTAAGGAINVGSDDSWEVIIQRDNNTTLDVGDSLYGIFNMNFYGPQGSEVNIGKGTVNDEWTGVFMNKVVDKQFLYTLNSISYYAFAFAPDPSAPWAASAPGAMVLMYDDPAKNFTFNGGPGSDEANAMDGEFFWALGFSGTGTFTADGNVYNDVTNLDEAWIATNSRDSIPASAGGAIGNAEFGLNRVFGFAGGPGIAEGWDLGGMDNFLNTVPDEFLPTEFSGIVSFKTAFPLPDPNDPNGSLPPAWPVENDLTRLAFQVNRIVPVPAAAWMGLALLGALGIGRRLRRR